jgi:hypothetical protein
MRSCGQYPEKDKPPTVGPSSRMTRAETQPVTLGTSSLSKGSTTPTDVVISQQNSLKKSDIIREPPGSARKLGYLYAIQ